ncbi:EXLDI protein [Nocardia panacis]|uniref:EXLDI protein n=1 Tax=Nocardia panacis TaxID=2340916 RepID=A0A3A4JZH6_9NOCA|nr:EXLDI protein [Nocardia panacis]RJO76845.1 EXLDI protein [Nocardia panacis]
MPNKTIYVADDDLPLFQRAQELVGGNLSGAVVTALRRFIELEEGRQEGYEEVVLRVGHYGARQVRFSGALLGELHDVDDERSETYKVYRSRKGKFVLHTRLAKWSEYPTDAGITGMTNWRDWKNWRRTLIGVSDQEWGDFTMEIVDAIPDLEGRIPDRLYRRVADLAEHPHIEDLDI